MKITYHKGDYEYLAWKKKSEILKTVSFFAISFLIFLAGVLTTKTKANYLTIIAVLGCLPASKSAVSAVMHCRIKQCSGEFYSEMKTRFMLAGSFHLYFTSYDKNFPIAHLFIKGNEIIAFTEEQKLRENEFEEHVKLILEREGKKGYHVKLYQEKEKYFQRMEQLLSKQLLSVNKGGGEEEILSTLYSVSL